MESLPYDELLTNLFYSQMTTPKDKESETLVKSNYPNAVTSSKRVRGFVILNGEEKLSDVCKSRFLAWKSAASRLQ